jgi:hypothetical protein
MAVCCARALTDQATAPTIIVMNSRRFIAFPWPQDHAKFKFQLKPSKQESETSEMGTGAALRCGNAEPPVSQLGQNENPAPAA